MQLKIINRLILVSLFSQVCKKKPDCFYTMSDRGPILQSFYPGRGSLVGTNITLSWSCIQEVERVLIYTVHFGPSQADMPLIATQTKDSLSLKDLIPGKTYYWSIFATDECNHGSGTGIMNFTVVINNDIPFVSTDTMFIVHLNTTAPVGGNVLYGGSSPVSERGIFYSTEQEPEKNGIKIQIGEGLGSYSTLLSGLVPLTKYYIKAYAVNSSATVYGQEITFNSGEPNVFKTVNDIEGNIYNYVRIGTQAWFAENLKTTKFNDGTPIPLVTDNSKWESLSTPGYCYMNNDSASYRDKYGALYNGWTVNTGNICPVGWHVPTESDWTVLEEYLGGSDLAV